MVSHLNLHFHHNRWYTLFLLPHFLHGTYVINVIINELINFVFYNLHYSLVFKEVFSTADEKALRLYILKAYIIKLIPKKICQNLSRHSYWANNLSNSVSFYWTWSKTSNVCLKATKSRTTQQGKLYATYMQSIKEQVLMNLKMDQTHFFRTVLPPPLRKLKEIADYSNNVKPFLLISLVQIITRTLNTNEGDVPPAGVETRMCWESSLAVHIICLNSVQAF